MNTKKMYEDGKKVITISIYQDDFITVYKDYYGYTFEIGKHLTTDVLEAVAIMMKNSKYDNSKIWDTDFKTSIDPINSLYWLSGGDEFWKSPEVNKTWNESFAEIISKFESKIEIASKKNKLSDIRNYFKKNLNLDTFYEYSLRKGII